MHQSHNNLLAYNTIIAHKQINILIIRMRCVFLFIIVICKYILFWYNRKDGVLLVDFYQIIEKKSFY